MQLTILMPCLNEIQTIGVCIKKAKLWIDNYRSCYNREFNAEILIADNGSADGSIELARSLGARVIEVSERGYGNALFQGCLAAKGEYIIMGDSDDSYDFSNLTPFLGKLKEGYDLVMGNRFLGGIAPGAMPWKNRYIGNPILTYLGKILFLSPCKDFHCGLRAVKKEAFLRMDLRTTGMEFASEMVIKASIFGMRICEVPTTLAKDGRSRSPHLRPWRDGWRHLRFMLLFSPIWLLAIPGGVLLCLSLVTYLLLLTGSRTVGAYQFDIHTLFYAQFGITFGLLSLGFSLIIRMVGVREGLLGKSLFMSKMRSSPFLEIGMALGLIMIVCGAIAALDTFISWSEHGFGKLEYFNLLRAVSLSTLLMVTGCITLLISIVVGFLSMPTREQRNI